jgi:hypothetical protein
MRVAGQPAPELPERRDKLAGAVARMFANSGRRAPTWLRREFPHALAADAP